MRRILGFDILKSFWLKSRWLDRIQSSSNYNIYWGMDKTLRSWDVFQTNSSIDKQTIQMVFAYRFQPPFGQIQLAFQKGSTRFGVSKDRGAALFIKLAYVL